MSFFVQAIGVLPLVVLNIQMDTVKELMILKFNHVKLNIALRLQLL